MENYNAKLSNFAERVNAKKEEISLQEVKKIEFKKQKEVQLNVWIPKSFLLALKQRGLNEEKSIKEQIYESLDKYLNSNNEM